MIKWIFLAVIIAFTGLVDIFVVLYISGRYFCRMARNRMWKAPA